ncbi:MAG: RecQ family ATP-dependent DNA helicase [Microscillaceae bacterium]|nr:RecQ family ATP-dependent DNA helicase [Microscillaceae bacterium]MDW8461311.1 ATP-dependent DNA helicase RecQ [Cytophagales bacterium]
MENLHEILQKYWGYKQFRPLQEEIIRSVLAGNETLALLPTGGGKSICFQVPAMALEGMCLVISPLVALMKDQVENLQKRGISATAIYAGLSHKEIGFLLDECIKGNFKFLYVSPERLKTELFRERAKQMNISLLAIDEAHCISQWGYDFRPPYLEIAQFRTLVPQAKIIALTASATPEVCQDIQQKLSFGLMRRTFQKSFARANLSYACLLEENKEQRLLKILHNVQGTAVVYVRNRKRTQEIAKFLQKNKISADFYHAGLNLTQRNYKQEAWIKDKTRVIVATNAFGMGIDKPDVRIVVHLDLPESLEAYYQEAGRAGRDEKKAYAIILYQPTDIENLTKNIAQKYPSDEDCRRVYQSLANYCKVPLQAGEMESYPFDLAEFQQNFQLKGTMPYYALKRLEAEGFIQLNEAFYRSSKVKFAIDYETLYEFQIKHPKAEPIIRLLQRLYGGGMFSQFVSIQESQLAKFLDKTSREIVQMLERLQELQVIEYEKQNEKPQVTFLTPRYESKYLPLSPERNQLLKQKDEARAEAMKNYVLNTTRCRTQLILDYFGEISYKACGICDTCLTKKRNNEPLEYDFEALRIQIKDFLQDNPLNITDLANLFPLSQESEFIQVIRSMVETNELVYLKNGKIAVST